MTAERSDRPDRSPHGDDLAEHVAEQISEFVTEHVADEPDARANGSREDMKRVMAESDLIATLGGIRGVIESSVAGVVFALAYSVSGQNLRVALWAAIISGLVVVAVSLVQRRSLQQAVTGFFGIVIMAAISRFTGKPEDFYLWPILKNAGFAAVYLLSAAIRWPLIGVILGPLLGEGIAWRKDPARLRAYTVASLVWAGMFGIRFAVQLPLYLAGNITWLGFQAIPLGLPLFLLVCWVTFIVLARVPLAKKDADGDAAGGAG